VFVNGRSLVALNPFDGEVSWEFPLSDAALGTAPSPVVAGDLLVASSIKAGAVAVQLTHKDERTTASGAWQNAELTGYFCTPVVCGKDHVYMITSTLLPQPTSTLRCIEVKTGKEAWQRSGVGVFSAGLVRVADDRVLVLDDKGVLRLLEHDPKGYRELATAQACGASFVTPALADGCLYVRDARGVACLLLGG
jgi:outer membrane protein assembly factor BamB